jgi:beta-fructofuranosidase
MKPIPIAWSRREFLRSAAAAALLARGAAAQTAAGTLADDPMRPQFHLLPARNWMNDPNGPIYCNGRYHMFFQYNPQGATWGNMSWNHAVSPDMLHWSHLPLAMTPTPGGPDAYGCFSGSAIQVGGRVYFVYTATKESTPELATIRDGQNRIQESQCLAWSDDRELLHWTKDPNPIVARPPRGMNFTGFRDPSAWHQDGWYYMTVGSGESRVGGSVLLYRSPDMKSWQYLHPLATGAWNGKPTPNPCDDGSMWECPDFFALDGGHVLIYSTLGKVFWQSGELDRTAMRFHAMKQGVLDLDAFYAPKTQTDARGRRILWGWMRERRPEAAMRAAGWSGMMSLPRVLTLDPGGTLRMRVLPEAAKLRAGRIASVSAASGRAATLTLPRATGELLCTGTKGSAFELTLTAASTPLMGISYSPQTHTITANGKQIALEPNDAPTLHAFVDGSLVELIVGERIGYALRFYYKSAIAPDVHARLTGTNVKAEAWKIDPISPNRLTT